MATTTDPRALARAADCVLALEQAMRSNGLWHAEAPAPADMASRTPFCADTLEFTEWLQFIFVPRLHEIIENGGPLPPASGIAVMAETRLNGHAPGERRLIDVLAAFDRLIDQPTGSSHDLSP